MVPITTSFGGAGDAYDLLVQVPTESISSVATGGWDGGAYMQSLTFHDTHSVPEPGTLSLFGAALAGIWMTRRRKAVRQLQEVL